MLLQSKYGLRVFREVFERSEPDSPRRAASMAAMSTFSGPITVHYAICRNNGVGRNMPSYEPAHLRSVALRTAGVDKALHETFA
jgi:hypothetical protein